MDCFFSYVKLTSAYWHFNTSLLLEVPFKQLCQQYTRGFTKDKAQCERDLEIQVVELQSLAASTGGVCLQVCLQAFKSKRSALASVLCITAQGVLVRSCHIELLPMYSQSQSFFGLE